MPSRPPASRAARGVRRAIRRRWCVGRSRVVPSVTVCRTATASRETFSAHSINRVCACRAAGLWQGAARGIARRAAARDRPGELSAAVSLLDPLAGPLALGSPWAPDNTLASHRGRRRAGAAPARRPADPPRGDPGAGGGPRPRRHLHHHRPHRPGRLPLRHPAARGRRPVVDRSDRRGHVAVPPDAVDLRRPAVLRLVGLGDHPAGDRERGAAGGVPAAHGTPRPAGGLAVRAGHRPGAARDPRGRLAADEQPRGRAHPRPP
jgi:hypothetical protein